MSTCKIYFIFDGYFCRSTFIFISWFLLSFLYVHSVFDTNFLTHFSQNEAFPTLFSTSVDFWGWNLVNKCIVLYLDGHHLLCQCSTFQYILLKYRPFLYLSKNSDVFKPFHFLFWLCTYELNLNQTGSLNILSSLRFPWHPLQLCL